MLTENDFNNIQSIHGEIDYSFTGVNNAKVFTLTFLHGYTMIKVLKTLIKKYGKRFQYTISTFNDKFGDTNYEITINETLTLNTMNNNDNYAVFNIYGAIVFMGTLDKCNEYLKNNS